MKIATSLCALGLLFSSQLSLAQSRTEIVKEGITSGEFNSEWEDRIHDEIFEVTWVEDNIAKDQTGHLRFSFAKDGLTLKQVLKIGTLKDGSNMDVSKYLAIDPKTYNDGLATFSIGCKKRDGDSICYISFIREGHAYGDYGFFAVD